MLVLRGHGLGWPIPPAPSTQTAPGSGSIPPCSKAKVGEQCVPDDQPTPKVFPKSAINDKYANVLVLPTMTATDATTPNLPGITTPAAAGTVITLPPSGGAPPAGYTAIAGRAYPSWWLWVGGAAAAFLGYKFVVKPRLAAKAA